MLVINLDPPHQGNDEVAPCVPVRVLQPVADQGGEPLQLADDEPQRARLFGSAAQRRGLGLELGEALAHARQPRLELGPADHALGVAVDQPADAGAQLGQLALDRLDLRPARPGAHGLQAALVFVGNTRRVVEQPAHLGPDRRVQQLDRQGPSVTAALAIEAGAVRPGAAIVAVAGPGRTQGGPPSAAQRMAAGLADTSKPWSRWRAPPRRWRRRFSASCACTSANSAASISAGTGMSIHCSGGARNRRRGRLGIGPRPRGGRSGGRQGAVANLPKRA
jgi:hypothetical protein